MSVFSLVLYINQRLKPLQLNSAHHGAPFFSIQRRAAVKTQESVEPPLVTKTTSAKVSLPDRSRRNRRSSSHSSSENDSKAVSTSPGRSHRHPLSSHRFVDEG